MDLHKLLDATKLYMIDLETEKKSVLNIPNCIPSGDVFFAPDE
ncbi:hypothetical protein N007_13855 [Alicyclobacillus acidoterrestris ATCC 49025]|nr:hypothetical protein N007_13855 [Alicyclobacillus acidoterrestris ATCC 49025]